VSVEAAGKHGTAAEGSVGLVTRLLLGVGVRSVSRRQKNSEFMDLPVGPELMDLRWGRWRRMDKRQSFASDSPDVVQNPLLSRC
jgi:hypothetical protein